MNAAFLLVTSAMLVGQAGDKHVHAPAPAAVASNYGASSCCEDPCANEGFGHRLRDRLRGLFSRDCSDSCKSTTCHSHHVHTSIFRSSCDDACQTRNWSWKPLCRSHQSCEPACAPAACADACDDGRERGHFLKRLRARFYRGDDCCDSGCSSSSCGNARGSSPAPATNGKTPEKIETPPREMPKGGKKKQEVRIEQAPAPIVPNVIQVTPTVPSVDIAPVPTPAPRVDSDRRDPF